MANPWWDETDPDEVPDHQLKIPEVNPDQLELKYESLADFVLEGDEHNAG